MYFLHASMEVRYGQLSITLVFHRGDVKWTPSAHLVTNRQDVCSVSWNYPTITGYEALKMRAVITISVSKTPSICQPSESTS